MKKVTSAARSPATNLESTSTPGHLASGHGRTLFSKDDRIATNTIHPQKLSVRLRENDQLRQDYNIDEMEHPIASFIWTSRRVGMARKLFSTTSRKAINAFYESEESRCQ